MSTRYAWHLSALLSLFVLTASGQESGQIGGIVRDPRGAVIPNASITAIEEGTGFASTVRTGSDGEYVIPSLRPTTYTVTTAVNGFKKSSEAGVALQANQSVTLNITLEIGTITETINVNSQAALVDTSSPGLAEVVDESRIVE